MKEIRFRAWYKGRFWYFSMSEPWTDFAKDVHTQICLEGIPFEQLTPWKDKNGDEIYENDFIQISGHIEKVVWGNKEKNETYGHGDCGTSKIAGFYFSGYYGPPESGEIVGNTHQPPADPSTEETNIEEESLLEEEKEA